MRLLHLSLIFLCSCENQQQDAELPEAVWQDQGVFYSDVQRCYMQDNDGSLCENWHNGGIVSIEEK
jgi:hypothetical protein